jgi:hypothetical protein
MLTKTRRAGDRSRGIMHKRGVYLHCSETARTHRTVQHALVSSRRPFVLHHRTYFDFVSRDTASLIVRELEGVE